MKVIIHHTETQGLAGRTCNYCSIYKSKESFSKNKARKDGIQTICKACDMERKKKRIEMEENWIFPFKSLKSPEYIEAREKLFAEVHGWWCNDGKEWKLERESLTSYNKRKKEERHKGRKI